MEYMGIGIAVCSLILSLYAVKLGRTNRSYDLLFKFYDDLRLQKPKVAKSVEEIIPPEPGEIDDDKRFIRFHNSFFQQENTEAKFNLLCYAVVKRQIPLDDFFALFAGYLQTRMMFWPTRSVHRIGNYPFTAQVIDMCIKKRMLPIRENRKYVQERGGALRDWKEGREALKKLRKSNDMQSHNGGT